MIKIRSNAAQTGGLSDVGPLGADGHIFDDRTGQLIDRARIHVHRVELFLVPTRPHHDVEARRVGDLEQATRIAPESDAGHVDDAIAAPRLEVRDLFDRVAHVG